jgi:hypothetical protein
MTLSGSKDGTFSLKTNGLKGESGMASGPLVKAEIWKTDKSYLAKES